MINMWTLRLTNFGKISNAEIKISPFMMFVGDNNTGKSYTLELLWSIFVNLDQLLLGIEEEEQFKEIVRQIMFKTKENNTIGESTIKIDATIQLGLIEVLNTLLHKKKEWLVEETFNYKIKIGQLSIKRDDYFDFSIKVNQIKENKIQSIKVEDETEEYIIPMDALVYELLVKNKDRLESSVAKIMSISENLENTKKHIIEDLLKIIIETLICKDYSKNPIYFPASRTGFMHTYQFILGNERRTLRNQLIHNTEEFLHSSDPLKLRNNDTNSKLRLTAPVYSYLEKLADIFLDDKQQEKYKEELSFLNENILKGKIDIDEASNYRFVPKDGGDSLPLHVTSSLIAEIAPISIFLSSQFNSKLFMIEESESHLHVKKQLQLVRMFFRLLNKGKSIWLTTHSDSFAQQVNNLLTLSNREDKRELFKDLGYEESDTIKDTSLATCYQFKSEGGKTVVQNIDLGPYGFIIPTFNDTLMELLDQTSRIQDTGGYDQ